MGQALDALAGSRELTALIERVAANPTTWKADELADELGYILPFSVRQALGLTTIGSFDVDKRGREQRRAANNKNNSTEWRRRNGAVPRAEWLAANSASRDQPWLELGISKSTYYRRKAKEPAGETGPNTPNKGIALLYSDQCHSAGRPKRNGADHRPIVLEGEVLPPETGGFATATPPPVDHFARAITRARVLLKQGGAP